MPEDIYEVDEIFDSFQFEGVNTGIYSRFVRFMGCNLNCSFCDTPQKGKVCQRYTLHELVERILDQCDPRNIVFTGGEPMLQALGPLMKALFARDDNLVYEVETNGTQFDALAELVHDAWTYKHITVAPKPIHDWWDLYHRVQLVDLADAMKFVIGPWTTKDIERFIIAHPQPGGYYWIQLLDKGDGKFGKDSYEEALQIIKRFPTVGLSVQTHKWLGIK